MFPLTRLLHFPLILGQVGLNLGKPTLSHLNTTSKVSLDLNKLCVEHFHKIKCGYSSVLHFENGTDVQEIRVEEREETQSKKVLAKLKLKMKLVYTCKVCDTRNTKYFHKLSYERGIVIVTCDCCNRKHLIADNLQWFKDNGTNVEKMLSEKGDKVKRGRVLINEKGEEIHVVQNSTEPSA